MFEMIKKIKREKKEYKEMVKRIDNLPPDYNYTYKKMVNYMWKYACGSGYDMVKLQSDLLEHFEEGVENGQSVLSITGTDVSGFCDELLKNAKTYTAKWANDLNKDINNHLNK